jgi:hypothetical protein
VGINPHPPKGSIMTSGVYKIENTATGDIYVGSSVNLLTRWKSHVASLQKGKHHNKYLQRSWDKYGYEPFVFDVLELVRPENLIVSEQKYIEVIHPSYNLNPIAATTRGYHASEETKQRISASKKGQVSGFKGKHPSPEAIAKRVASMAGYTHSKETREKMSESHTGKPSSMLGKCHTQEAKDKIGLAQTGKIRSQETCQKLSLALKGKPKSPEHRERMSLARKGRTLSQEHKDAIREGLRKHKQPSAD